MSQLLAWDFNFYIVKSVNLFALSFEMCLVTSAFSRPSKYFEELLFAFCRTFKALFCVILNS